MLVHLQDVAIVLVKETGDRRNDAFAFRTLQQQDGAVRCLHGLEELDLEILVDLVGIEPTTSPACRGAPSTVHCIYSWIERCDFHDFNCRSLPRASGNSKI